MTRTLHVGDERWRLAKGVPAEALFGPDGIMLSLWLKSGQATIVKERPRRSIFRVALPSVDFYLKRDNPARSTWLRRLLHPDSARAEFERGRLLIERGVPTPEPLAYSRSSRHPGGGFLLTRTIPDSCPLDAFRERELPMQAPHRAMRLRQRLAVALGQLLAQLHDAGVNHRDLHPGNLLLQHDDADEVKLWLIDLHAARVGRPLNRAASLANLVVLNRWFVLRSTRADRLRCWHAYLDARQSVTFPPASGRSTAKQIERATLASNVHFWKNRDRRCLGLNRYFQRLRSRSLAGHAVADLPAVVFAPFLVDPDAPFSGSRANVLKDSASSSVVQLNLNVPGGTLAVIYKRFAVTKWTDPWLTIARPSGALRSWVMGHGLLNRLLPTPRPLAVFHRYRFGLPREGYLITEKVADGLDLAAYANRLGNVPPATRQRLLRDLLRRAGRLVRTLHQRRLSHRDLKAPNLLLRVQGDGLTVSEVFFIDLVGVRRHRKLPRRRRVQNLARLHASFRAHPGVTRTDKLRFLDAYLARGLNGRLGWKRWWQQVAEATEAKVRRNNRTGRPLH